MSVLDFLNSIIFKGEAILPLQMTSPSTRVSSVLWCLEECLQPKVLHESYNVYVLYLHNIAVIIIVSFLFIYGLQSFGSLLQETGRAPPKACRRRSGLWLSHATPYTGCWCFAAFYNRYRSSWKLRNSHLSSLETSKTFKKTFQTELLQTVQGFVVWDCRSQ